MGRASRNPRSKMQAVFKEHPADAEDVYKKLKFWMVSHGWKAVCNLIPHVFETTGRGLMTLEKVKSGQRFAWAYYTVNTRAIYINDERQKYFSINIKENDNLAMAPFLDLFNHTCETVNDAKLITVSNNKEYYQIRALRSYDSQTQVFITYGAHSSLKLYVEYGFFIPNNPLDQIFFTLSDIEKCHRISASASSFIRDSQFYRTMGFTVEGLNYSAKNVLFVVSTDIMKPLFWKEKIYREQFDDKDLKLLTDLGLRILQCKKYEYIALLKNMTKIVQRSESFKTAISLIREYIEIIEKSLKYMKALSYN